MGKTPEQLLNERLLRAMIRRFSRDGVKPNPE
jgi:hypothetical protein